MSAFQLPSTAMRAIRPTSATLRVPAALSTTMASAGRQARPIGRSATSIRSKTTWFAPPPAPAPGMVPKVAGMPQLEPFYMVNEVVYAFAILPTLVYVMSKYILPRTLRAQVARYDIATIGNPRPGDRKLSEKMASGAAGGLLSATAPKRSPVNARPAAQTANYATLREIEGRLKSIRNIEKITKTMKIVASTKLTRAQRAMTESRSYGQTSQTVFEEAETKPVESEGKKTLLIVCSSDKGLCGGIHSGMTRFTRRFMTNNQGDYDIAVLGEKCKAQLGRSNAKNMVLSFGNIGKDVPTFADAQAIADQISLLPTDYASIKIIYNKFLNAQSYEATIVEAYSEEAIAASPNFAAFEIDDEVLANLREYALANSLFWALAEGHACEQSARRNAMDNASKNAGDMITRFQILFNRTRQAVITGELVEIITGAAASED